MVQKCTLCNLSVDDRVKLGEFKSCKYRKTKITVHYYCLLLTTQLMQNGPDNAGILGFLGADIMLEKDRISHQICYYCKKSSANISCCGQKCVRTFHLYCGLLNGALCYFENDFRTFCPKHLKPERKKCSAKDDCTICLDSMGNYSKAFSILSPCCRSGWFHKWCIAQYAINAGYFFKCPLCNNKEAFRSRLVRRGIFVPDRDAAWELEPNAFAELLERPDSCSAENCKCPQGRDYQRNNNELIMCGTCGSTAIHFKCMEVPSKNFICVACTDVANRQLDDSNVVNNDNNNTLPESEEVDVVNLVDSDDDDTDSVDSLLLTYVRGLDQKSVTENIVSLDTGSSNIRKSPKKSPSDCSIVSDVDLDIIYQAARKRRTPCNFRRFNSDHTYCAPKRKRLSSMLMKRSLSFESINKSTNETDEDECIFVPSSNETSPLAQSPKHNHKARSRNESFQCDSNSSSPTNQLTRHLTTSSIESLPSGTQSIASNASHHDNSLSPGSCKGKDTDCSSSGISSMSPVTSPHRAPPSSRSSRLAPLKEITGPAQSISCRPRGRALSMFVDRAEPDGAKTLLRARSESIDTPVRRSLRLHKNENESRLRPRTKL